MSGKTSNVRRRFKLMKIFSWWLRHLNGFLDKEKLKEKYALIRARPVQNEFVEK